MRIDVIRQEPHTLSLRPCSNSFSNSFIDFYSCEVVSSSDMRKNEVKIRPLRIHNGDCFETLNLPHVSSCELFWCLTWNETKAQRLSRLRSTYWNWNFNNIKRENRTKINKKGLLLVFTLLAGSTASCDLRSCVLYNKTELSRGFFICYSSDRENGMNTKSRR